ncbi:hypothetical protein [Streptomyces sp. NBC_01643]|uniref:hypothetical protein n=1 Tax=Streptomyces sp. NBC_01643 TaxID=2975906 RepID=UPI002F91AA98|nr:hypothetical protein OHB03_46755 [Streptomyces sp. NBC_01643]
MRDIVVTAVAALTVGCLLGRLRPWQRLGNWAADQVRSAGSWIQDDTGRQNVVVHAHAAHQLAHHARPGRRDVASAALDPNWGVGRRR